MTIDKSTNALEDLVSRDALHRLIMTYCRAADRGDAELMASIFHEDATVVSGVCNGSAAYFAREVTKLIDENLAMCSHSVANTMFDIDGDRAVGECYVIALNRTKDAQAPFETLTAGRYLDRFERRDGVWKILEHVFVEDFRSTRPAEPAGEKLEGAEYGARGSADPLYRFWQS